MIYMLEHQNQALTFLTHEIERLVCHQAKELHPSPDDMVWAIQFAYAIGLPPQQIVYALVEGEKKAFDTFKR